MRLLSVFIGLFLLPACKKTESMDHNNGSPVTDTMVVIPRDTTKKPADTSGNAKDTVVVKPSDPNMGKHINYLALGDSYTIGESVEPALNFPNQLTDHLNKNGLVVNPPKIIARTGWTTRELISAIENSGVINKFDFVTLLIGVNNQYRGESEEIYRKEFKELLNIAVAYTDGNKSHVFVVSIPDWGVTPFARSSGRDQGKIGREIDGFNAIARQEAEVLGVGFTDITPGSRLAASDEALIASDGLHPSAKMYKNWVGAVAPVMIPKLKM